MVELGSVFGKALSYSASVKRMAPFFGLNLLLLASLFAFLGSFLQFFSFTAGPNLAAAGPVLFSLIFVFVAIIIIFFVTVLFDGMITDDVQRNYKKEQQLLSKSLHIAKSKYWSMLGATVLASAIVVIVNFIPFVGWLVSIIVSWFFLFVVPYVIIGNQHAVDAVKKSYRLFMDNKSDVILFWILLSIITIALTLLAFLPIIVAALPVFIAFLSALQSGSFSALAPAIQSTMLPLTIGAIISAFILAYVSVYKAAATTFFFAKVRKK